MRRYADIVVIVLAIAWCVACVAMVLLGAGCQVYEEPEPACVCDGGEHE